MTRHIHVRECGRRTIADRARQMLAGLSEEEKQLLWELLRWKREAAKDWLQEHGCPRTMASHLTAELPAPTVTKTRTCDSCGKIGPVAEDQTDPAPSGNDLILDAAGIGPGRQNEYVCGACLAAAADSADEEESGDDE